MIKSFIFDLKSRLQRFWRGYADQDVWGIDDWFLMIIPKMLNGLSESGAGVPAHDGGKGTIMVISTDEDTRERSEMWKQALKRMAFLASEASENTCSMKNPYAEQLKFYYELFNRKWRNKSKLLKDGESRMTFIGPERDPEFGDDFKAVRDRYNSYENKIREYRNKCKDEFFSMFSTYFWDLWD